MSKETKRVRTCWNKLIMIFGLAALVLSAYAAIANIVIGMQHPEYTDTQRMIKIFIWDYSPDKY